MRKILSIFVNNKQYCRHLLDDIKSISVVISDDKEDRFAALSESRDPRKRLQRHSETEFPDDVVEFLSKYRQKKEAGGSL